MSLGKKKILSQGASGGIDGTANFSPFLYTGQGGIGHSGVGFRPDFVWIKRRDSSSSHYIFDSVRGVGNALITEQTYAEINNSSYLTSFDSDGFSLGTNPAISGVGRSYVAWCLKAGGSSTSSNSDGTLSSSVSVNTEAGFSIVSFTSNGAASVVSTGHGLSAEPEMVIFKNRSATSLWQVYHKDVGDNGYVMLNSSDATQSFTPFFSMTATTIGIRQSSLASNTDNCIAYCFHSVDGYQKIGSYQAVSGTLTVDVGFPIRFLMVKALDNAGNWLMVDSARGGSSGQDRERLFANNGGAGGADTSVDFTGNTFTITSGSVGNQNTGSDYLYWAIA